MHLFEYVRAYIDIDIDICYGVMLRLSFLVVELLNGVLLQVVYIINVARTDI